MTLLRVCGAGVRRVAMKLLRQILCRQFRRAALSKFCSSSQKSVNALHTSFKHVASKYARTYLLSQCLLQHSNSSN